jgi:4'-phosphopantetheinyl transferase
MLTQDLVQVWRVRLGAPESLSAAQLATRMAKLWGMLSPEEQRRADAFRVLEHRREYILAHAALRSVLGQSLGASPVLLEITAGTGTKPRLSPAKGPARDWPDLRFNLSHTCGAALIGVTLGRELGVDIEWQRSIEDMEAMARSVMSGEELKWWMVLEAEDQLRAFYHVWTRKESYLKAIGLGLFRSLQAVTVPVSAQTLGGGEEGSSRIQGLVQDREGQEGIWHVTDIVTWGGYSASVCWERAGAVRLEVKDLDVLELDGN